MICSLDVGSSPESTTLLHRGTFIALQFFGSNPEHFSQFKQGAVFTYHSFASDMSSTHDRISKKMAARDLDHRHNERIMQLIARPIGTFPPLDLRPRLDGAFLYRAPPFILPSVTTPHSITSSAVPTGGAFNP